MLYHALPFTYLVASRRKLKWNQLRTSFAIHRLTVTLQSWKRLNGIDLELL